MKNNKTRRLAAIMFTDIVGYTALMQQDENTAANKRAHHRQEFDAYHEKYNGEILQYFGDGTLSVFQSGVEAVECAIEIQRALKKGDPVPLRIGLHMGDIVFDGTDIYGDGVNLASRIESMGVAGAILLSEKLNDELKNQQQISTKSMGRFELKNIANPVEVFSVTNEGIKIPARSELKGKQKELTKNIAVLPFVNMSPNKENEYFTDGMTEEIINALAKIKDLKVTSRTSSFFFKNKDIPLSQIGKDLNVSTILEGSIRLSGNKMRITAQLINVAEDFHFWSETFDRSLEDIFAVQDEISLLIANKLREHLGHFSIGDHLVDTPKVPVEIYKKYLKGRFHVLKMNLPDIEKGFSILESVIKEQPNFALAYLGVNIGYSFMGAIGIMPAREAFAKGKPYLDKAIELAPDLPECQYHLAGITFWQDWDIDATFQHLNKAIAIRPGYADAHQSMAATLACVGKFEAGLNYIYRAQQLDPFSPMNPYMEGLIFYFQGDFEKALSCFNRSISLDAEFIISKLLLGACLMLLGREEESLSVYQNLPTDKLGDIPILGGITLVYAAQGEHEKAKIGIAKLEASMQSDSIDNALQYLVLCQAMMGNYDVVFQLIEQGITYRLPMILMLNHEPVLKPLRSDPRFDKLMEKIIGKKYVTSFSKKEGKKLSLNEGNYQPFIKEQISTKKKPLLDDATNEAFSNRLLELITTKEPYLDSSLTLKKLADSIDIHPNQLSWLLNQYFGKSFNEFINHYRVERFKQIAKDPKNAHFTLIGLAYESGFNSKTVFNTYFKKETGTTPKKWLLSEAK